MRLLSVVVATPSLTYNATPTPPRRGRGPACRLVGVASLDPERWKRAHPEFCRQTASGGPADRQAHGGGGLVASGAALR